MSMAASSDRHGDHRHRERRDQGGARNGDRDRTLPDVTDDEREVGWGDDLAAEGERRDAEWYRRERPPHHG